MWSEHQTKQGKIKTIVMVQTKQALETKKWKEIKKDNEI